MNDVVVSLLCGVLSAFGGGIIYFLKKLSDKTEELQKQIYDLHIELIQIKK